MEAPVIIDLPSTTTSQVNNKLVKLRQESLQAMAQEKPAT